MKYTKPEMEMVILETVDVVTISTPETPLDPDPLDSGF